MRDLPGRALCSIPYRKNLVLEVKYTECSSSVYEAKRYEAGADVCCCGNVISSDKK